MARYAKKGTTKEEILNKIRDELRAADAYKDEFDYDTINSKDTSFAKSVEEDIVRAWISNCVCWCSDDAPTTPVQKDLSKIKFDFENAEKAVREELLERLPDGTAILWAYAGGDWEYPVYFVVYIAPNNGLRAYIPSDGNLYCHHCKVAYGTCECDKGEEDIDNLGVELFDALPEFTKMYADACNRIQTK